MYFTTNGQFFSKELFEKLKSESKGYNRRYLNWGTFSSDEYNDKSINLLDGKLKDEIVEELKNPIFREKICLFDFWSPNE